MDGPLESSTNPMMQPRECVTPPPNLSLQGKILGLILSIITLVFYDLKEDLSPDVTFLTLQN